MKSSRWRREVLGWATIVVIIANIKKCEMFSKKTFPHLNLKTLKTTENEKCSQNRWTFHDVKYLWNFLLRALLSDIFSAHYDDVIMNENDESLAYCEQEGICILYLIFSDYTRRVWRLTTTYNFRTIFSEKEVQKMLRKFHFEEFSHWMGASVEGREAEHCVLLQNWTWLYLNCVKLNLDFLKFVVFCNYFASQPRTSSHHDSRRVWRSNNETLYSHQKRINNCC